MLSLEGENIMQQPYWKRHELLESLNLASYKPGDRRAWLKVKNRAYWKYELEREAAIQSRQRKQGRTPRLHAVPAT